MDKNITEKIYHMIVDQQEQSHESEDEEEQKQEYEKNKKDQYEKEKEEILEFLQNAEIKYKQSKEELKQLTHPNQSNKQNDPQSIKKKMQSRLLVNKQQIKGDGFQGYRKMIQREKNAQNQGDIENKQEISLLSGTQLQTRYVEQWLNDVLKDAQELDMPGILQKPEHQKPLQRYEIDRINLNGLGLSNEIIDRVYRSLFVHSVGFFGILKEATNNIQEGKDFLRINIWKVFQILLECACQTDYKLITQTMEQENVKTISELRDKNVKLTQDYMQKDDVLSLKLQRLKTEQNYFESERAKFQDEKMKVYEELTKIQKKIEEEIKLRLFFESKLNSLHHMNMEHESNFTLLKNKYDELLLENTELQQKFQIIEIENKDLKLFKIQAEEDIKYFKMKEKIEEKHKSLRQERNQSLILEIDSTSQNLVEQKNQLNIKISEITIIEQQTIKDQLYFQNKNDQVETFQTQNKNQLEQISHLGKQIEELKKNKLEFIGVSQQNQLFQRQILYQEDILKDVDKKQNSLYTKIEDLEIVIDTKQNQINALENLMKNDKGKNQILETKVHELTCLKDDLERRLKYQIQQCEDLQVEILHLEKIYKNIKKENLNISEDKFKMKIQFEKTLLEYKNASDTIQEIKTQQNQKELILRQTLNTITFEKNELIEQNKKDTYKVQYFSDLNKSIQNENIDLLQAKQIQEKELEDLKIQFEQIKEKKEALTIKKIENEQLIEEQNRQIKNSEGEIKSLKQFSQKEKLAFETLTNNQKQKFNIVQMQSEDSIVQLSKIQDKMKIIIDEKSKIKKVLGKFGWKFVKVILFQKGFQEQKLQLNIKIQELGEQVVDQLHINSECNKKIFQLESSIKNREQQNQQNSEIQTQNIEKLEALENTKENQQKLIENLNQQIKQVNDKLNTKTYQQGTQTPIQFYQNTGIDEFSQTSDILENIQQQSKNLKTQKSSLFLKEKSLEIQESQKSQKNQQQLMQTVFQNILSQETDQAIKEYLPIAQKKVNKKEKKQQKLQNLKREIKNSETNKTPQEMLNDEQILQNLDDFDQDNQIIEVKSEKQINALEYQNNCPEKDSEQDKRSLSQKKYLSIQNSQKSKNKTFKIKSAHDKQSSKIQSIKQISSYKEISSNIEVMQEDDHNIQNQDQQIQSLSSSSEQMESSLIYENQVQILRQQESDNLDNADVNINDGSQKNQVEQEYEQVFEIDENHVYSFFGQRSKEQIFSLVKELNQLNQVKLCGGFGMCFDCRNQHVGKNNNQNVNFQNVDYRMQQIERSRQIKGTYFKKELQKIIKGYMPPTSHTLSTRFFETYQFNNMEEEQRRENQDDFITKASSLQALSNKNINFEDQQIIYQTKMLDMARLGLAYSHGYGQSSIQRNIQTHKIQFEDESLKIPFQQSHQNNNNFQKKNFSSAKQKLRSSVANVYSQNKNIFGTQGGYIIQNDAANLVVTSGQLNNKNQQYNFNSSSLKEFELTNLKKNKNKISNIIQKNLKNNQQTGMSPIGVTQVKFQGRNGNLQNQIQKKSYESISTNQNNILPSFESLKNEEVYRPKTNQQPQEVRMNKKNEIKSSEAYSNHEIAKHQYSTGMRSMSQKGRERNLQTQNSIEQLRSQSQLLSSKYEFQIYKQYQIQQQSRKQQNNEDLNEIAINVEQYLTSSKPMNEFPNLQQSQLQLNVPSLFQAINKIDNDSENSKNVVMLNKFINTVSDANINDTIRDNLDDNQSNQNSLIQNNQLGIKEVKVEVPLQLQNQKRVSIMKVKNLEMKKDYKNAQYSLFKNTNTKSNENLGQIMRNQQLQEQQMMINLQNLEPQGVRQIQSSKKEYTTSNDEISKRLQNRLESSRNSELNKFQEQENHLKKVNDSYQIEKLQNKNYKQAKQIGFSQTNDQNLLERSFYNDSKSSQKQGQQFFDNRTKSQVDFYKRNIKKFF